MNIVDAGQLWGTCEVHDGQGTLVFCKGLLICESCAANEDIAKNPRFREAIKLHVKGLLSHAEEQIDMLGEHTDELSPAEESLLETVEQFHEILKLLLEL